MENKTNYVEPNEVNDFEDAKWNPLDEPVNDKPYASAGINVSQDELNKPIEEPRFAPPPMRKPTPQGSDGKSGKEGGGSSSAPKREPFNKDFSELSKKDTEAAAEHSAKMALKGYEWLHSMANKYVQISEKKLTRLQIDGEINLNVMIEYDYGREIRSGDFFKQYNEQLAQVFVVSEEFKDEFVPLLTKVLAKRGIGMTDEQRLAYLIGEDIATKGFMFFQIKKGQKDMIDRMKENTMAITALQKEMENVKKQNEEYKKKEEEYKIKKDNEKPAVTVSKRGRPANNYKESK